MCVNQREITNKYTGHKLYVKCGHCPACQQEKAAYRVSRIKANDTPLTEPVMVTLTYRRYACPYVLRDDAYKFSRGEIKNLSVFRDQSYRRTRVGDSYDFEYSHINETTKICDVDFVNSCSFSGNRDLKYVSGKIGVCYYPDVQRFIARLRLNLKRLYKYEKSFKTYICSEYGWNSTRPSLRPHFHVLLWVPKGDFTLFRSAVIKSWPYGDIEGYERRFEKAFRASSYVASYVNSPAGFPHFLKMYFKPKHSYSKGFGCNLDMYKLSSILEKIERGTLSNFVQKNINGFITTVECPYPKYIIHRYFPKFKGYNRLAPLTLSYVVSRITEYEKYSHKKDLINSDRFAFDKLTFPVYYTDVDIHRIAVRLNNAYKRFLSCSNGVYLSFNDYISLHQKVWRLYDSTILRLHLTNVNIPIFEKYDNLEEVRCKVEYNDSNLPIGFSKDMLLVTNPNDFISVRLYTSRFSQSYYDHVKHRGVNNLFLSSFDESF